jgi:hypothetical protein
MKKHFSNARVATSVAALLVTATLTQASAELLSPSRSTCTSLNCGTLSLPGRINSHPASPAIANHWVMQFEGKGNSCLRFHVTTESADLSMSVVSPDGAVFSNSNSGLASCSNCPLVVVRSAKEGFYTVVVGAAAGLAKEATFTLRAGLYNAANSPNCSNPTKLR